ncbi:MAG: hypothetical protein AAFU61_11490, partial [Pseudomonadota bacterium]
MRPARLRTARAALFAPLLLLTSLLAAPAHAVQVATLTFNDGANTGAGACAGRETLGTDASRFVSASFPRQGVGCQANVTLSAGDGLVSAEGGVEVASPNGTVRVSGVSEMEVDFILTAPEDWDGAPIPVGADLHLDGLVSAGFDTGSLSGRSASAALTATVSIFGRDGDGISVSDSQTEKI